MNFSLVGNAGFIELMLQCFLVYLFQETRSEFIMNFHHTTLDFVGFIRIYKMRHIIEAVYEFLKIIRVNQRNQRLNNDSQ